MPRTSKTVVTKRVTNNPSGGLTQRTAAAPTASVTKRVSDNPSGGLTKRVDALPTAGTTARVPSGATVSSTDRIPETFRFLLLEDSGFILLENNTDFLLDEF